MAGPHHRDEHRAPAESSSAQPQRSPPPDSVDPGLRSTGPPLAQLPNRIGRFTVLEQLGTGGMGLVCAAFDPELGRKVAIKLLSPRLAVPGKADLAHARLLREAQAMARLAHPNVVTVHEVGTHGELVYIAMEFIVGVTLKHWLRRTRRTWTEVLAVFLQAGRGLAAAHAAGLIHRDFKPDNVMVTEDPRTGKVERVRVFDFGVVQETREAALRQSSPSHSARTPNPDGRRHPTPEPDRHDTPSEPLRRALNRSLPPQTDHTPQEPLDVLLPHDSHSLPGDEIYTTGLTAAGALVGTPLYMAPEQYDQAADERSDQFSFCCALYEALYRRRTYVGDTAAKLQQAKLDGVLRRPPRQHDIPPWLHAAVVRGLASNPTRRYPSMEALLTELGHDHRRRTPLAIALASVGLLGVAIGLAWTFLRAPADACRSAAASLDPVWNPVVREQIHTAFRDSQRPHAETAWTAVDTRLAAYADAWSDQRIDLCRSARDPETGSHQLALRGICLEQRRDEFSALLDLLASADGDVVDNAVEAALQLQPVRACDDPLARVGRPPPPTAELPTEVRALEHRIAELRAHEQTGKYAAGLELADTVVRDARSFGQPAQVAEALYWQGLLHSRVGAPRLAEAALIEAMQVAEESRHDLFFARATTELVRVVGVDQERHAEGMIYSLVAASALRRQHETPGEIVRRGYLGHLHELRGELRAAQAEYNLALEMARTAFPDEDHPQVATALDDLAGMQQKQGDYQGARANYEKVLQIREATQGPGHPRVAEVLGHLGRVALDQGQHERARGLFERALGLCDDLRACGPADRAEALVNFGRVEHAMGHHAEARKLHEEALVLYETLYGREHGKVAAVVVALGGLATHQERHDEAAAYYQRALAIQRKLHAEDHPAMAAIHARLGTLARVRGRLDEARESLERALAIHEKTSAYENFDLAQILDELGVVARAQKRLVDALALHARARTIYRRNLTEAHAAVVGVTIHLAEDQLDQGDGAAAEALLAASLRAQEQVAASPETLAPTRFLLARAMIAPRPHLPGEPELTPQALTARRQQARALAESALASERLIPGHRPQVDTITAWLQRNR